jgi:hypothetical protein
MEKLIKSLLDLSEDIRYVAIYQQGELTSSRRLKLVSASNSESDKYEELIVNPTMLTLVTQRGNIDCGGTEFVLIRYGNFYQIIIPRTNGHLSISVEPFGDPLKLIEPIQRILRTDGEK